MSDANATEPHADPESTIEETAPAAETPAPVEPATPGVEAAKTEPILAWRVPANAADGLLVAQLPTAIQGHTALRIDADNAKKGTFICALGTVAHRHPVTPWCGSVAVARQKALAWLIVKLAENRGRTPQADAAFARIEALLAQ